MMLLVTGWSRNDGGGVGVAPAGFRDVSAGLGWVSMVTAGHQQAEGYPLSRRNETNVETKEDVKKEV